MLAQAKIAKPTTDPALLLRLYRSMLLTRRIELEIARRYGEQEMRCPVHLSVGQEAISTGVCEALGPGDQVLSTHRAHAHYIAKGGHLGRMLAEFYGRAEGCCGGRGGSMHLFDDDAGVLMSLPIVASSIPIAVGAALGFKQEGSRRVAVAFFGDAAVEEGVFHESANFASLKRLPVVFVCENNLYSVYTHLSARQPNRPITDLAEAHGLPHLHADGNDVLAVHSVSRQAVDRARAGEGPTFLLFDTYRWLEHCGPNYDNDIGYRTEAEFQQWKNRCPVEHMQQVVAEQGVLDAAGEQALIAEVDAEIRRAFDFARAAPLPEPSTAGLLVYAA